MQAIRQFRRFLRSLTDEIGHLVRIAAQVVELRGRRFNVLPTVGDESPEWGPPELELSVVGLDQGGFVLNALPSSKQIIWMVFLPQAAAIVTVLCDS